MLPSRRLAVAAAAALAVSIFVAVYLLPHWLDG